MSANPSPALSIIVPDLDDGDFDDFAACPHFLFWVSEYSALFRLIERYGSSELQLAATDLVDSMPARFDLATAKPSSAARH